MVYIPNAGECGHHNAIEHRVGMRCAGSIEPVSARPSTSHCALLCFEEPGKPGDKSTSPSIRLPRLECQLCHCLQFLSCQMRKTRCGWAWWAPKRQQRPGSWVWVLRRQLGPLDTEQNPEWARQALLGGQVVLSYCKSEYTYCGA